MLSCSPHARTTSVSWMEIRAPTQEYGAISPNPSVLRMWNKQYGNACVLPVLDALDHDRMPLSVSVCGLMLTPDGPKLLGVQCSTRNPEPKPCCHVSLR